MFRALLLLSSTLLFGCAAPSLAPADLDRLTGAWHGELAYIDYASGEEYRISVNMQVVPGAEGEWAVLFTYPEEPDASDSSTWVLSADGTLFDAMNVTDVHRNGGALDLLLETEGEDDNTRARIRKHWRITADSCVMRKEVSAAEAEDFRLRHTYRLGRVGHAQ